MDDIQAIARTFVHYLYKHYFQFTPSNVYNLPPVMFTIYTRYCLQFTTSIVYNLHPVLFTIYPQYCLQFTPSIVYNLPPVLFTIYSQYCLQFNPSIVYNLPPVYSEEVPLVVKRENRLRDRSSSKQDKDECS